MTGRSDEAVGGRAAGPAPPVVAAVAALEGVDGARRAAGRALDALGLGPVPTPSDVVLERPGVRLRHYGGGAGGGRPILVVPAPIKRAYIWDLVPEASVVRRCHEAGFDVFLAEWTTPGPAERDLGLADYADRLLAACADAVRERTGEDTVLLAGHSLGGTLAAVFAALHPGRTRGLVLVEAPLHFGESGGPLSSLAAVSPPAALLSANAHRVPGSFLDAVSTLAAPREFVWARWADALRSTADRRALETHLRVTRWTLDEFPLPARLFSDIVERLYRHDEFATADLEVGGRAVGPRDLTAPMLSVLQERSLVAPPASVLPVHHAAASRRKEVLPYEGDVGVGLPHVGPLVGRRAHEHLWPSILAWAASLP